MKNKFILLLVTIFPVVLYAQKSEMPHEFIYVGFDFGKLDGPEAEIQERNDKQVLQAFNRKQYNTITHIVSYQDAPWIRVFFDSVRIGLNSFVRIRSLKDDAVQIMDPLTLLYWNNSTAFFNGNAVEITLFSGGDDRRVGIVVDSVMAGLAGASGSGICGTADSRQPSNDPAVGRWRSSWGCTAWLVSNGCVLTAGHCVTNHPCPCNTATFDPGTNPVVQFNVPASNSSGNINHPSPQFQYPVDINNIAWGMPSSGTCTNGECYTNGGEDWAVFRCFPLCTTVVVNNNRLTFCTPPALGCITLCPTNLNPFQAQEAFYRMSRDIQPSTGAGQARATGYGVDVGTSNETQQTHNGTYEDEIIDASDDVNIHFRADIQPGNSGGPIIATDNFMTIGIVTNSGCDSDPNSYNQGTGFENNDLENAIHQFPTRFVSYTNDVVYIDANHPTISDDGTVLRPYDDFSEGYNAASSTNATILSVVTGAYQETMSINKPVTIQAPVGPVVIGPNATLP